MEEVINLRTVGTCISVFVRILESSCREHTRQRTAEHEEVADFEFEFR